MMPSLRVAIALGAALVGIAATVSLGNWQLRRAAEKVAIEQSWDAAAHLPPRELHGTADLATVAGHLPQRVRVQGRFEHDRTIWLDNRALEGRAGFLVVTPLRVQGSQAWVLVNRGWAPRDPAERTRLPPVARPEGEVVVEGLALAGVPRVFQFTSADVGPIRQNLDLDEMRAEIGAPVAEFVLQQSSATDDGLDRRWIAPATGVDRHRGYAFQWFSLTALLAVIVLGLSWRLLRDRSAADGAA